MSVCNFCGDGQGNAAGGTLLDTSGGIWVEICDGCRERLEQARCRLCGSAEPARRSEGLIIHVDVADGEQPPHYHVCDGCRRSVAFLTGDGAGVSP